MEAQLGTRIEPRDSQQSTADAKAAQRTAQTSPRTRARITGVVYLLYFVLAVLGEVFLEQAGVSTVRASSGDAAAIANGILAHESSYRIGLALGLVSTACYVALIVCFYQLFRPVSRSLSLLAVVFGLMGCACMVFGSLFQAAPLVVLGGSPYLSVFSVQQLQALALIFLNLNAQAGSIALVFFGLFQIVIGYVMFRSTFLPRTLGVLIAVAGLGWLTILAPPLAKALFPYIAGLGFIAEGALMLWLLLKGVNSQRWNEQAGAADAAISA